MKKGVNKLKSLIGAILALETVVIVQLVSISALDIALLTTVLVFAASIPLLSMSMGLMLYYEAHEIPYEEHSFTYQASMVLGCFLGLIGLVTLFWHLNPAAGFMFACLGFGGLYWVTSEFN